MGVAIPQVVSATEDRASGAQVIDGGLRFDSSKKQYLTRTFSTPTNNIKWTWSGWIKRTNLATDYRTLFNGANAANNYSSIEFDNADIIRAYLRPSSAGGVTAIRSTSAVYRDISGWYHISVIWDSANATAADRLQVYVNGTRILNFSSSTDPTSSEASVINSAIGHGIGRQYQYDGYYFDGFMSQIYFIDGQALDASYFGYTDPLTNTWRPKKLSSSIAFGTNGFYLPFDGNSPIGQDQSGRGNNWTPVNFGGSNTIEKATGALPILNTDGGGKVARVGVRTDSNASSLVLALPLVGIKSDFSNRINSGTTEKAITANGGISGSSAQSVFYGGSYYFDGGNDWLNVPGGSDFAFGTGDFTIECWVYTTTTSDVGRIVNQDFSNGGSGYGSFLLYRNGTSLLFYSALNGSSWGNVSGLSMGTISASTWTHLAITRQNGTVYSWKDGVNISSVSGNGNLTDTGNVRIGCYGAGLGEFFNGYIQDFRLYKGTAKYTQNFIPASTDPDILPDTPSGVAYSSNVALVPSTDGAVAFDGSGDYLSLADNADFTFGTGDLTVEAFVYPTSSSDGFIFDNRNTSGSPLPGIGFGVGSNTPRLLLTGAGPILTASQSLSNNIWHHVAVVKSSGTFYIYINGVQSGSTADSTNLTSSSAYVGGAYGGGSNYFPGFISNLRITKGTALYTSNFTPPTGPISSVANTKLLCCKSNSSATTFDVSPGTITANGNAVASNFNPFTVNINTQRGQESGYATLNPTIGATQLGGSTAPTYADGNSRVSFNGAAPAGGTIGVSSGKWYFEVLVNSAASTNNSTGFGIRNGLNAGAYNDFTGYFRGVRHNNSGNLTYSTSGDTGTSAGAIMAAGEVYGLTYDVDNNYFALYKNGVILVSSSSSSLSGGTWFPYAFGDSASGSHTFNFGQKPFKFPPPAGFQPLALANTPRPTIVRPDQYVGIVTYTGTASVQSITGLGNFKPDFVWIKDRGVGWNHQLYDSVRGVGANKELTTSQIWREGDTTNMNTGAYGYVSSLDASGFTLNPGSGGAGQYVNQSTKPYVAWCWKAGGNSNTYNINDIGYSTASAAGLTAGTITPTGASVNTKSGFSIIGYTGTGANATISHGLGNAPSFIIIKKRTSSPGDTNWRVYHNALGNTKAIYLSSTGAADTSSVYWNNTSPTSSVFTLGSDDGLNASSQTHIAYLWAEIPGFSKFGSYTGNSSSDGPVVVTGFRPRWILIKCSSSDQSGNAHWLLFDGERNKFNVSSNVILGNLSDREYTASDGVVGIDILSNGFKIRDNNTSRNGSGTYIYAAFAETPNFNLYGGQSNAR